MQCLYLFGVVRLVCIETVNDMMRKLKNHEKLLLKELNNIELKKLENLNNNLLKLKNYKNNLNNIQNECNNLLHNKNIQRYERKNKITNKCTNIIQKNMTTKPITCDNIQLIKKNINFQTVKILFNLYVC